MNNEARILRAYLDKTEANVKQQNSCTDEFKTWLLWARKKADWYDPQLQFQDELLDVKDKENMNKLKNPNIYGYH